MPIDPTPGSGNEPLDKFMLAMVESIVEEEIDALTMLSIVLKTITRTQGEAVAQHWVDKLKARMTQGEPPVVATSATDGGQAMTKSPPYEKSPWEDATRFFDLDFFIRDLTSMAPTITDIMTARQSELSRICLKKFQEPGGRERVEATAAALTDLAKRAHDFSGVATEAWLYLQAEMNDPGGRAA